MFKGFTLPEGAWLPPELIDILPDLSSSQVKIVIVIVYSNMKIGGNEPISYSDMETLTGLSRQTCITCCKDLLNKGIIVRNAVGQSFTYEPSVKDLDYQDSSKLIEENGREKDSTISLSLDSLNLLRSLKGCGVYGVVARRFIDDYSQEYIRQHLKYYEYAVTKGYARGPGFIVQSIKENWGPPLGYKGPVTLFEDDEECLDELVR